MRHRWKIVGLSAAAVAGLAACGGSKQQPAEQPSAQVACAAQMNGLTIAVQDVVGGARVTYSTPYWRQADQLRAEVNHQLQPSSARAAGGEPDPSHATLPPVTVQVQPISDGTAVTWIAADQKDADRVRELIRWDADVQQRGYCSQLQVPASSSFYRTPNP